MAPLSYQNQSHTVTVTSLASGLGGPPVADSSLSGCLPTVTLTLTLDLTLTLTLDLTLTLTLTLREAEAEAEVEPKP